MFFNELDDLKLALNHDENAKQKFLKYKDEELSKAIDNFYKEEDILARQEAKQDNYNGDYIVNLELKSYQYVNGEIEKLKALLIKALCEYGLDVEKIEIMKI